MASYNPRGTCQEVPALPALTSKLPFVPSGSFHWELFLTWTPVCPLPMSGPHSDVLTADPLYVNFLSTVLRGCLLLASLVA